MTKMIVLKLWAWLKGCKFPKRIDKAWFAEQAVIKELESGLPPYWDNEGRWISYKRGDIVPMRREKGFVGYYQILGWTSGAYGMDLAMWDDGREYYLKLHHIERDKDGR